MQLAQDIVKYIRKFRNERGLKKKDQLSWIIDCSELTLKEQKAISEIVLNMTNSIVEFK